MFLMMLRKQVSWSLKVIRARFSRPFTVRQLFAGNGYGRIRRRPQTSGHLDGSYNTSDLCQSPNVPLRAPEAAMKLTERVVQSRLITPQEVSDVLGISLSHARNLTKGVESGTQKVDGRSGISYNDLIDSLYDQRNKNSYAWARKLETTLGVHKRARTLHFVPDVTAGWNKPARWHRDATVMARAWAVICL